MGKRGPRVPGDILARMPTKPARSVLLCIADDWSPIAGCYGDDVIRTPHIDALAQRATVFDHAFCTTPSCAASRASILTGQHSHTHGQYGHCHGVHGFRTHEWMRSLPAVLRDAGCASGLIGKAHVLPRSVYPFDLWGEGGQNSAAELAGKAAGFFADAARDRSFFLHAASSLPHRRHGNGFPLNEDVEEYGDTSYDPDSIPVPPWLPDHPAVRQDLADYYGYVERYDRFVGAMLEALERSGRADETLVIVMTDHGMPFPAAKASPFEAGHHCPLLIARPGGAAQRSAALVSWLDILPTVLEWMGVDPELWPEGLTGRALAPILDTPNPEGFDEVTWSHNHHAVEQYYPYRVLRGRRYKYVRTLAHQLPLPHPSDLFRSATWTAIREDGLTQMGGRSVQDTLLRPADGLYDLVNDPLEIHNLFDHPDHAATGLAMRDRLLKHRRDTKDPWLEVDFQEGVPGAKKTTNP